MDERFERQGGPNKRKYGAHLSEKVAGEVFLYMTGGSNRLTPDEVREYAYELISLAGQAEQVAKEVT